MLNFNNKIMIAGLLLIYSSHIQSSTYSNSDPIYSEKKRNVYITFSLKKDEKNYMFIYYTGAGINFIDSQILKAEKKTDQSKPLSVTASSGVLNFNEESIEDLFYLGSNKIYLNKIIDYDLSALRSITGDPISGTLGSNFRRRFILVVDNIEKNSSLYKNYNFEKMKCLPYTELGNEVIGLTIKLDSKDFLFRLDTGESISTISEDVIPHISQNNLIKLNTTGRLLTPQRVDFHDVYIIKNIAIDSDLIDQTNFIVKKNNANRLGLNFLSNFESYAINPFNMEFCYQGIIKQQLKPPKRSIGLLKDLKNNHITVVYNDPNEKEILKEGDIILSVDNKNVQNLNMENIRYLINHSDSITVLVKRNGKNISIQIK